MNAHLCIDFLRHADWVWRRIANAEKYGFPFGEETITEIILLHLKMHHPHRLLIQPFGKKQERWNGADWEWWIGRDGNWIGMRVQAKRISLPDEAYKSIFYQAKDATKMQIEYLIELSQKARPQLIPIYTLYTHSNNLKALQAQAQHCDVTIQPPPHQYGCLVAHAQDVKVEGSINLTKIAPLAFPWHCLVCHCASETSGSSGPADYIANLFRRSQATDGVERDDRPRPFVPNPVRELPQHILLLRSGDDPQGRNFEKYAEEWDLGGVAVFDLGEAKE